MQEFEMVTTVRVWEGEGHEFGLEFGHPDGTTTRLGFTGAQHIDNLIRALERLKEKNASIRGPLNN